VCRIECPACGGSGCEECGETGRLDFYGCPWIEIPPIVWETIELAGLYKRGLPPIAGGALDQARAFVDAARFVWHCQAEQRAGTLDALMEE